MKNRLLPLLTACLVLTGCNGLPTAREMGDMALLRTMGIDASPEGVAVTGSTGPRAKGIQAEGEPALTLAADRESLSGACLAMQGQSDSYVFFGYVDQLLLGEALAERGIRPVLDYFARDTELGLGAQLWLVRGASARDALSAGGNEGVDSRLETLQADSKMGIASLTRTAGEVYADLLELGSAYVPVLSPVGDESAVLAERGYGILKGDALVGFLEGEAARGLELLAGGSSRGVLEAELPSQRVSVRITSARTQSRLEFQGDAPSRLKLVCTVEARLSEYESSPTAGEAAQIPVQLARRERSRIEAALALLKRLRADCAGLGVKGAVSCPAQWQGIQEEWPMLFSALPTEVEVAVVLNK